MEVFLVLVGTCAIVSNPYNEDGFRVESINTEFGSWDPTNINYTGSRSINAGNVGEVIGLDEAPVTGPLLGFTLEIN